MPETRNAYGYPVPVPGPAPLPGAPDWHDLAVALALRGAQLARYLTERQRDPDADRDPDRLAAEHRAIAALRRTLTACTSLPQETDHAH